MTNEIWWRFREENLTLKSNVGYSPLIKESYMEAYCVKCRGKKEMKNAKAITMKNSQPVTQEVAPPAD